MLAAIMSVLSSEEERCEKPGVPQEKLVDIRETINFLTKRLAAFSMVCDPSAPRVNMAQLQRDLNGKRDSCSMMWDVARGFARRVPMTKLVHMDSDIRPYLAALMIAALYHHGKTLKFPQGMKYEILPVKDWENMIMKDAARNYDQWGVIGT